MSRLESESESGLGLELGCIQYIKLLIQYIKLSIQYTINCVANINIFYSTAELKKIFILLNLVFFQIDVLK